MKNVYAALAAVLIACAAHAQPVLTAANSNPVIGDVLFNYYSDTSYISSGPSGAGVTWDYSYLAISARDTEFLIAAGGTPYFDSFPTSSMVLFVPLDSEYDYMTISGGEMEIVGGYSPANLGGVNYFYDPIPGKYLPYPLTYGDSWRDTSSQDYDLDSTSLYDHIRGFSHNVADAYGTLITPEGTYYNVLRVTSTGYSYDTNFYYNTTQVDTGTTVAWYSAGHHFPLLEITYNTSTIIGGNPIIAFTNSYYPESVNTVEGYSGNYEIYPNPASDAVHVRNTTGSWGNTRLSLINAVGRTVWDKGISLRNGDELTIPVSLMPSGLYILRIQSPSGTTALKLEIQKN